MSALTELGKSTELLRRFNRAFSRWACGSEFHNDPERIASRILEIADGRVEEVKARRKVEEALSAEREKSAGLEARVVGLEVILAGREHALTCRYDDPLCEGYPDCIEMPPACGHKLIRNPCDCFRCLDPLKVGQAVMAFIAKIEEIDAHPALAAVFSSAAVHGCQYNGPNWSVALKAVKDALMSAGTEKP